MSHFEPSETTVQVPSLSAVADVLQLLASTGVAWEQKMRTYANINPGYHIDDENDSTFPAIFDAFYEFVGSKGTYEMFNFDAAQIKQLCNAFSDTVHETQKVGPGRKIVYNEMDLRSTRVIFHDSSTPQVWGAVVQCGSSLQLEGTYIREDGP